MGTSSRLDSVCHDIEQAALSPLFNQKTRNKSWISAALWRMFDQKNALPKLPGPTNHTAYRRLNRKLKASFKVDRKQQAATAGALAQTELNQGKIRKAWNVIHHLFIKAENQLLPLSQDDLRKVKNDCITLYSKSLIPDRIPVLVALFDIGDVVEEPDEIAQAV